MLGLLTMAYAQAEVPETRPSAEASPAPQSSDTKPLGIITKITFQGINSVHEDVVADIATLKVGDELTRQKLENSINDLRKWGVFSQVEILVEYSDEGIALTYDLKEGYIIKDVHIKGNYPLLKSKVQRVLFLNPGIIYDHSKLADQVDRLDRLYEENGYFGTTVFAIEDYDEQNHQVTLYFRIKKGATYRIRKTEVEGNAVLNEGRIKNIIFTFTHFKPRTLKTDLQKIKKLYTKKGFVRARVRVGGELYDYDARKVDLDILIRQGPRVKVEFEGNKHFFTKTLKKEITIFEDGDFDEFELDASKKKLRQFYLEHGYEQVKIEWKRRRLNKDYYLVTFEINEGPQHIIEAINFTGNEHFPASRLRKMMASKPKGLMKPGYFFQALFEQDLETIESFYKEQGFPHIEIVSWEKTFGPLGDVLTLTVDIKEGPRSMVKEVSLKGLPEKIREEIQQKLILQPGTFYSTSRLSDDIQIIIINLSNIGFPYAEVSHEVTEPEPNQHNITFKVQEGKKVRIGRVLFVGNAKTLEKVLRKNLRIKEGDIFSTENILQSQINIRGLGIFDSVVIETLGLSSRRKKVNLVVRVQERKDKILDFEVGYNTDLGFSGKVVFQKLNIWGTGRNLNVKAQGGNQVNRGEVNVVFPRFNGTSLTLTTGAFGGFENRPFFESTFVGMYGSLFKRFGRILTGYGRLDFGYVDNNTSKTVFDKINPSGVPNNNTRLTTTLGMTYDTRDNFGDPRAGLYINSTVSLTDQFIQQHGNYFTLRANLGHWWSPIPRVTIANALRVGDIVKIPGDTVVQADARFYAGGDTTVRGFKQDSLLPSGGSFSLIYNLELQIRVYGNIMVVGFLDTGAVTNGITQVNSTTLRHSAGPGIRYLTPVGPIRLDWGFVLDPEPGDATTNRVHFSFGYFF